MVIVNYINNNINQKLLSDYYYYMYLIKDVKIMLDEYYIIRGDLEYKIDGIDLKNLLSINSNDVNFVLKMTNEIYMFNSDTKIDYYDSDFLYYLIHKCKYKDIVKDCNKYLRFNLYKNDLKDFLNII